MNRKLSINAHIQQKKGMRQRKPGRAQQTPMEDMLIPDINNTW